MHRSAASAALHAGPRNQRLRCVRLLNIFVLTAMSSYAVAKACKKLSCLWDRWPPVTAMLCQQDSEDDADEDISLPTSPAVPTPAHPAEQPEVAAPLQAS